MTPTYPAGTHARTRQQQTAAKLLPGVTMPAGARAQASGRMNKGEAAYGGLLEAQRAAGEIEWYGFEAIRYKLADNCTYTPDYSVRRNGRLEAHEVKAATSNGRMLATDDARVKMRVFPSVFPWVRFVIAIREGKTGAFRVEVRNEGL